MELFTELDSRSSRFTTLLSEESEEEKNEFLIPFPLTPVNAGDNCQCSEDNKVEKNCSQDTQQQAVEPARLNNDNFERNQSKN